MTELHFQRAGNSLMLRLGDEQAFIPFASVELNKATKQRIYDDAAAYGRELFDKAFHNEQLQIALTNLPVGERLLLITEDPLVAAVPWEYLRDKDDKLIASRLNLVRCIPEALDKDDFTVNGPLKIIAVAAAPVDESPILNAERAWRNLIEAVTVAKPAKSLTITRVRPPTITQMEHVLSNQGTTIVHFIGYSTSHTGEGLLAFEDTNARSHLVSATDFANSLNTRVFLVVLDSCLSAIIAPTEFGNIARSLVHRGFPYALGMQFFLPDDAAVVMSKALYAYLLQGISVEETVTRVRRALEEPRKLANPAWLAGIPVLYTSLREQPTKPLRLTDGQPVIQPDPEQLQKTCDLTALPSVEYFVGRGKEISQVLNALMAPPAHGFVLLHGLGGIGKTAIARAVTERVGWQYQDRMLAISFETFASIDGTGELSVNEQFADRFYNRLARFYGLDPAQYSTSIDLQSAILQRRAHLRSLLVLDNFETLIDAQMRDHPIAKALASFIARLKEGDGAILLTSRIVPSADWGDCQVIYVSGLSDEAGADLFLALLPSDREHLVPPPARIALSHRVQGHPLSIRLLAGRFADESATNLATFLQQIETELKAAEQRTPFSLEDPERQRTLHACMDYSVRRLFPEQRKVLDAVSLFLAPFLPEFASYVLDDEEQTPRYLKDLVRFGLLAATVETFPEGELFLLELHPMLRWYILQHLPAPDAKLQERYGKVYEQLARQSYQLQGGYDQSSLMRYLVRQSLPDFEAALQYLPPTDRSSLAYHLAETYERLGQNRHALALYEQALEIYQELGDVRGVAVTQHAMADVLVQLGKPQEAMTLYEQSLHTKQELGDVREVAVTQANFSQLLLQQDEYPRALVMAWEAYTSLRQSGFTRDAQIMQQLLISIKGEYLGPAQFDALWQQVISNPQPDWLREVQAGSSSEEGHISAEQLKVIIANTITVMTDMPEKREEWREAMSDALQRAQGNNQAEDTGFFTAILAILDDQSPSLPEGHPHTDEINSIKAGIAAGGQGEEISVGVSGEVMQAIRDFVNAEDWDATRQVVEAQQSVLFRPEVETLFEQNIANARSAGDQRAVGLLEQHLALLRGCKTIGIAQVFEQLAAAQEEQDAEEDDLPFDAELISRSIAALMGGPQEKMAHAQYLMAQAAQTEDEELKALLNVIQLALFSKDFSQLGRDLHGVYRQAWEGIAATVEAGGVDPRLFEAMARNTLSVLGPASNRRSEWRNNLVELRNQATAQGNRNMVALTEAVIGLLDAGGNPAGLGEGLQGIYAQTWQGIVQGLPN